MPLKQLSQLWGQFNQLELPVWLRSPAIRLYIWMFNCCLDEADIQDLKQYPNVGEFFQRRLRPGVRPINSQPLVRSFYKSTFSRSNYVNNLKKHFQGFVP